jgi:hypothetical protein
LWHGTALVLEDVVRRSRRLAPVPAAVGAAPAPLIATNVSPAGLGAAAAGLVYTLAAVIVGWVFFRARSFHDAIYILQSWTHLGPISYGTFKVLGLGSVELLLLIIHIVVLIIFDGLIANRPGFLRSARTGWFLPMLGAVILFYDIVLFGAFGSNDFIYFQF